MHHEVTDLVETEYSKLLFSHLIIPLENVHLICPSLSLNPMFALMMVSNLKDLSSGINMLPLSLAILYYMFLFLVCLLT
jgi:hypothetical protein